MKQIKNKSLRVLVALAMVLTLVFTSMATAIADTNVAGENKGYPTFSSESVTLSREVGATYYLDVNLETGVPFASYVISLYMPDYLRVTGVEQRYFSNNATDTFDFEIMNNGGCVKIISTSGYNLFSGICTLFTISYEVAYVSDSYSSPYLGEYQLTNADVELIDNVRGEFGTIAFEGDIVTPTRAMGDVDNDGDIDLNDLIAIQRYILNPVNELGEGYAYADIDRNGIIDLIDCQYMQQYLVGQRADLENVTGGGNEGDDQYTYVNLRFVAVEEIDGNINTIGRYNFEAVSGSLIYGTIRNYIMDILPNYDFVGVYSDSGCTKPINFDINTTLVEEYADKMLYVKLVNINGDDTEPVDVNVIVRYVDENGGYVDETYQTLSFPAGTTAIELYNRFGTNPYFRNMYDSNGNAINEATELYNGMTIVVEMGSREQDDNTADYDFNFAISVDGQNVMLGAIGSTTKPGTSVMTLADSALRSYFNGVCYAVGVYRDYTFTEQVTAADVLNEGKNEFYILIATNDVVGEYDYYEQGYNGSYDDKVTDSELAAGQVAKTGSVTVTETGATVVTPEGERITGTYVTMANNLIINYGDRSQFVFGVMSLPTEESLGELMVNDHFVNPNNEESAELKAIEGVYQADMVQGGMTVSVELFADGVYCMSLRGIVSYGIYTYSEADGVVTLDPDDEYPMYGIIDVDTKTMQMRDSVSSGTFALYEQTDDGSMYVVGSIALSADGNAVITKGEIIEQGSYLMMNEGMAYVRVGDFKQYTVMISETGVTIMLTIDGSNNEETQEFAAIAGNYEMVMYGMAYDVVIYSNGIYQTTVSSISMIGRYSIDVESGRVMLNDLGGIITVTVDKANGKLIVVDEEYDGGNVGGGTVTENRHFTEADTLDEAVEILENGGYFVSATANTEGDENGCIGMFEAVLESEHKTIEALLFETEASAIAYMENNKEMFEQYGLRQKGCWIYSEDYQSVDGGGSGNDEIVQVTAYMNVDGSGQLIIRSDGTVDLKNMDGTGMSFSYELLTETETGMIIRLLSNNGETMYAQVDYTNNTFAFVQMTDNTVNG